MSDNENLVMDDELYPDEYDGVSATSMDDTTTEEMSMEDKKKAINLEDLVYVKKYIDIKHDEHVSEMDAARNAHEEEVDTKYSNFISETRNTIETEINSNLGEVRTSINNIVNGTTTVPKAANATNATNANNSTKVNNLEIVQDANGVLKIGDVIIPQKKLIYDTKIEITDYTTITLSETIKTGDVLEIIMDTGMTTINYKFQITSSYTGVIARVCSNYVDATGSLFRVYMTEISRTSSGPASTLKISKTYAYDSSGAVKEDSTTVYKVYKVIE